MALVSAGFYGNVEFSDYKGDTTTRQIQLNAADLAGAAAEVANYIAAVEVLTDCVISGYTVAQRFVENALVLPTEANLWEELILTLAIDGAPNKSGTVTIPAPTKTNTPDGGGAGVPGLLFAGTSGESAKVANTNNGDLIDFVALYNTGASLFLSDGENASFIRRGRLRQSPYRRAN